MKRIVLTNFSIFTESINCLHKFTLLTEFHRRCPMRIPSSLINLFRENVVCVDARLCFCLQFILVFAMCMVICQKFAENRLIRLRIDECSASYAPRWINFVKINLHITTHIMCIIRLYPLLLRLFVSIFSSFVVLFCFVLLVSVLCINHFESLFYTQVASVLRMQECFDLSIPTNGRKKTWTQRKSGREK